jgi:anaerobic magnesium-protoporphyrin IX monomethyl ester cyclase
MNFVSDKFNLSNKINEYSPDIVGVSCDSTSVDSAYYIARICAAACPNALRVIGGIHATVFAKEVLKKSFFQAAFLGDAVESFAHLIVRKGMDQHFDFSIIEGLKYKDDNGGIFCTGPCKNIFHIDEYPSVVDSYDLVGYFKKKHPAYIFSTLGCQYRCIYCARATIRKSIRYRDQQKVVNDMVRLYDLGYKKQFIHDDTFASNRKKTMIFLKELKKNHLEGLVWGVQTRVTKLIIHQKPDHELMIRMKEAGCIRAVVPKI